MNEVARNNDMGSRLTRIQAFQGEWPEILQAGSAA